MALQRKVEWEVRGLTGDDTNGGGFDASSGVPGTNYSQQATAQITYTDLVVGATTTQLTSAANPFTAAHVGNLINITGNPGGVGTFTTGRYQVISVSGSTATMDRAVGTAGSTNGAGKLGGCLATIQAGLNAMLAATSVGDQQLWVRADGTYTLTSGLTASASLSTFGQSRVSGYTTTHGDNGMVSIVTASAITMLTWSADNGSTIENFDFNGQSTAGTTGITVTIAARLYNCRFRNMANEGIKISIAYTTVENCEVTGCGGTNGAIDCSSVGGAKVARCYVHDNTQTGIAAVTNGSVVIGCIVANNTGASSDGIVFISNATIIGNLCYGNGRDGIRNTSANSWSSSIVHNNILAKNGGFGMNFTAASSSTVWPNGLRWIGYNGFWSNTSGLFSSNVTTPEGTVSISGTDPTNDPFVNKASYDWTLNNEPNAGALLRDLGWPPSWIQLTMTSYPDMGPSQHGGPIFMNPGMSGGFNG